MQILVLGMHRSGTSALTQLLQAMGCYLGSKTRLLEPDEWNPTGYSERRDVIALNDRMLRAAGAEWWRVSELDLKRVGRTRRRQLAVRGRKILDALEPHRPWVLKDPRMCLTLPLWQSALENPVCVLICRSPLEVARSLHKRDRMPIPLNLALWEFYNLSLLRNTRKLPRLLLSYHELTRHPVRTARRLYRWLEPESDGGLHLPTDEETLAVVDPSLRRQQISSVFTTRYLSPPQLRLARALADRSALAWQRTPQLSPLSQDLLRDFEQTRAGHRALEKLVHRERRRYEVEVGTREQTIAELRARLVAEDEKLTAGAEEREELAAARDRLAAERNQLAAERDRLIAEGEQVAMEREQHRGQARRLKLELESVRDRQHAAERLLSEAQQSHADALRLSEQRAAGAEARREELLAELETLASRKRIVAHLLIEERATYSDRLRLRDQSLAQIREALQGTHKALLEEREERAEERHSYAQALADGERLRQEMQAAFDALRRQHRATAKDLETHRQALARARQDYREVEELLLAERQRFDDELRLRDQAHEHQDGVLAEFERSVLGYRSRLETIQRDLVAHREALMQAREERRASEREFEKALRHYAEELRIRDEILPEKDRVITEFARSNQSLQELVQIQKEDLRAHHQRLAHDAEELRAREERIARLEARHTVLEASIARLSKENRLALPMVLPTRFVLRMVDRMRAQRR